MNINFETDELNLKWSCLNPDPKNQFLIKNIKNITFDDEEKACLKICEDNLKDIEVNKLTNYTKDFKPQHSIIRIQKDDIDNYLDSDDADLNKANENINYLPIIWGTSNYGNKRSFIIGDNNLIDGEDSGIICGNDNNISVSRSSIFVGIENKNINIEMPGSIVSSFQSENIEMPLLGLSSFYLAKNIENDNSICQIFNTSNLSTRDSICFSSNDSNISISDNVIYLGNENDNITINHNSEFIGYGNKDINLTDSIAIVTDSESINQNGDINNILALTYCKDLSFQGNNIMLLKNDNSIKVGYSNYINSSYENNITLNNWNIYTGNQNDSLDINSQNLTIINNSKDVKINNNCLINAYNLKNISDLQETILVGDSINDISNMNQTFIMGSDISNIENGWLMFLFGQDLQGSKNNNLKFIFGYKNDPKENTIIEIANDGNILEVDKTTGAVNLPKITNDDIDKAPDTILITKNYFNVNATEIANKIANDVANDVANDAIENFKNEYSEIIEIDKTTGAVNLPKITNDDIDKAPDTTLITKSYFNANLNKMNQALYEAQKEENIITINIDKYLENSVNIADVFDLYENNNNINLIFDENEKTCLGELILKVPLKKFLSSSYEKYIQVNSENSFINLKVNSANTTNTIISSDYFLENMISSFYDNESSNIDTYNDNDKIVFKFSIQAEIKDYILIGPISIYIEYGQLNTNS